MSKRKIITLIAVVAFLALTAVSTFAFVATRANASDAKTSTVHLAFTGIVTHGKAKGAPITGGLTEVVRSTGYFNGNLHLPDGTQVSTSGKLDERHINISFYNVMGAPIIEGVGKLTKAGDFVGTFRVLYKDKTVDTGIWSALPVAEPKHDLALAFVGIIIKGTGKNTIISGAIVLHSKTLVGTFNEPDGTILPVSAKVITNSYYNIRVSFADGAIVGFGRNAENPANSLDKGYAGPFKIAATDAVGKWVAFQFGF